MINYHLKLFLHLLYALQNNLFLEIFSLMSIEKIFRKKKKNTEKKYRKTTFSVKNNEKLFL